MGQSAGLVVRVTRGQGSDVVLVVVVDFGGRVITLVMTPVGVDVVEVEVRRMMVEDVLVVRRVLLLLGVGQATAVVRMSMAQPW